MKYGIFARIILVVTFLCPGCGYTTRAFFLPPHITSVHVETFQNKTDQPGLENEFRIRLTEAFQNDGNLKIASAGKADAIVRGEITGYSRQTLRYSDDEAVWEYRLDVSVNFEFFDKRQGAPLVREDNFTGKASFYLSGAAASSEASARREALADLAKRMLNKVLTLW